MKNPKLKNEKNCQNSKNWSIAKKSTNQMEDHQGQLVLKFNKDLSKVVGGVGF